MKKNLRQIAEEAGFLFFTQDEDSAEDIDWSCYYTKELEQFADIIVDRVCDILESGHHPHVDRFAMSKYIREQFYGPL